MMQIKPLRSMVGSYGRLRRNRPASIDDHIAEKLISKGLAVPYHEGEAAGMAPVNPTGSANARTGGKTGVEKPSSSSQAGRVQKTSRSTSQNGARASSQSTKDGG
ncbi:hypothetical protein [Roseovarius pacificus]|uniref:hypothetical protein n=1 Tax=Roseovarius pacificus TaxID=337701 RepID=UPI002A1886A9|nr:hypothetical protein [Roseovarius pacificus]